MQCNVVLCYAMLRYVMQCNAMQCNAMQCFVVLCYVVECNEMKCNLVLCNVGVHAYMYLDLCGHVPTRGGRRAHTSCIPISVGYARAYASYVSTFSRSQKVGIWPSSDPNTKQGRKTSINHATSILQLCGVYCMCFFLDGLCKPTCSPSELSDTASLPAGCPGFLPPDTLGP